jgi:hypothetical protein
MTDVCVCVCVCVYGKLYRDMFSRETDRFAVYAYPISRDCNEPATSND